MNWKLLVPLFLIMLGTSISQGRPPLSVVIIGGGPAGLATAIEAALSGAVVTVVEKRSVYERPQRLFLLDHSLELLKKWGVNSPELKIIGIKDERLGLIRICLLEEALLHRAQELGVTVLQGEFQELQEREVLLAGGELLPFDLLVGADGAHSLVRQALGIALDFKGQGKAGAALIRSSDASIDISPELQHGEAFVRKFQFPGMSLIFMQHPQAATKDDIVILCQASGWQAQAEQINADQALLSLDVDVYLQRARRFSLEDRGALLVGDAAGTASFFRGMGANHALQTAENAGEFLKTHNYVQFEEEMDLATNALIEDSSHLFLQATERPF